MNPSPRPKELDLPLRELIDIPLFQSQCDSFYDLTGLPLAILDCRGTILIASGWKRICTNFHRKNPDTASRCLSSDTLLANRLEQGKKFTLYQCPNGLIDAATPIIIDGRHLGNLFTGQFLFDTPDMDFFRRQADTFGFNREKYLAALAEVPIISRDHVTAAMDYLVNLTRIIARAGIDKKRLMRLNRDLEQQVKERTADLELEKVFSDSLIRSLPGAMYVLDPSGNFSRWNRNFEVVTGYSPDEILGKNALGLIAEQDRSRVSRAIARVFETGQATVEAALKNASGKERPYLFTGVKFKQKDKDYLIGVGLDISKRIRTEAEKAELIKKLQHSLADVKQLSGLLPICASCKKIRDDQGYWNRLETYIHRHSRAKFSHGICPECSEKLYGEQEWYKKMKKKEPRDPLPE